MATTRIWYYNIIHCHCSRSIRHWWVCVCVCMSVCIHKVDRTSRYYNVVKKMHITRVTTHAHRLPILQAVSRRRHVHRSARLSCARSAADRHYYIFINIKYNAHIIIIYDWRTTIMIYAIDNKTILCAAHTSRVTLQAAVAVAARVLPYCRIYCNSRGCDGLCFVREWPSYNNNKI